MWWIFLWLFRKLLHFLFLCHHVNQRLYWWTRILIFAIILNMQRDIASLGLFILHTHLLDRVWNYWLFMLVNFLRTLSRLLTDFVIVLCHFLVHTRPEFVSTFTHHLALVMFVVNLTLKLGKIQGWVEAIHTDGIIDRKVGLEIHVLFAQVNDIVIFDVIPEISFIIKVAIFDLYILIKGSVLLVIWITLFVFIRRSSNSGWIFIITHFILIILLCVIVRDSS